MTRRSGNIGRVPIDRRAANPQAPDRLENGLKLAALALGAGKRGDCECTSAARGAAHREAAERCAWPDLDERIDAAVDQRLQWASAKRNRLAAMPRPVLGGSATCSGVIQSPVTVETQGRRRERTAASLRCGASSGLEDRVHHARVECMCEVRSRREIVPVSLENVISSRAISSSGPDTTSKDPAR